GKITKLTDTTAEVTYTPNPGVNGPDSFAFTVSDAEETSPAATVEVQVTPGNDAPVANAASVTTAEDTGVVITLSGTDADGDPLTFSVSLTPSFGVLSE